MQPLRTPNLDLSLDQNVAVMDVTGKMKPDTLAESFEWFDEVAQKEGIQLMVIMRQDSFDDLSEAAAGFRQVGDVLRRLPGTERCTVLTDSAWLRSTAKIEASVVPGLDILTFDPSERDNAALWLRGEPLVQPEPEAKPENFKDASDPWASLDLSEVAA